MKVNDAQFASIRKQTQFNRVVNVVTGALEFLHNSTNVKICSSITRSLGFPSIEAVLR